MRRNILIKLIYLFILIVSFGCQQYSKLPIVKINLHPDHDGIVRDIAPEKKSEHSRYLKQKAEESLGLQDLRNGSKGLEIRIWEGEGVTYRGRLFLLRNEGNLWEGELYYYRDSISRQGEEGMTGSYEGATAIEKLELNQTPREWKEFVNELFELEIDQLRDYTQIPEYSLGMDEGGVLVEIAQEKSYKVYQLPMPSSRAEKIKDAKHIVQILALIDRKFGNKLKDSSFGG